jgi:hypothetical protein
MPSKFNSTAKKPGKAVKKPYNRGGRTAADMAGSTRSRKTIYKPNADQKKLLVKRRVQCVAAVWQRKPLFQEKRRQNQSS